MAIFLYSDENFLRSIYNFLVVFFVLAGAHEIVMESCVLDLCGSYWLHDAKLSSGWRHSAASRYEGRFKLRLGCVNYALQIGTP